MAHGVAKGHRPARLPRRLGASPARALVSTTSSLPFSPGGTSMARVARVDLPQRSVLKPLYAKAGFADAFAIDLPSNATGDAEPPICLLGRRDGLAGWWL